MHRLRTIAVTRALFSLGRHIYLSNQKRQCQQHQQGHIGVSTNMIDDTFFALTKVIELNDDDSYDECAAKPVDMNDRTRAIFVEEWPNVRARNAITY